MKVFRDLRHNEARPGTASPAPVFAWLCGSVRPTLLVAAVGLAVSAIAWISTAELQNQKAEAEFQGAARNQLLLLQEGFTDFDDVIRIYSGFIEGAGGAIDRDRLDQFASPLLLEYKGISNFAWVRRVLRANRPMFEAAARRELGDFQIAEPSAPRPRAAQADQTEYYPILYALPRTADQVLVGADLRSDPARRAVLDQARDSGELVVSGVLTLLSERTERGVIAVKPIYGNGPRPNSIDERRQNLVGWALAAFRFGEMIEGILKRLTSPTGFHVYVYRVGASDNELPIYVHTSRKANIPALPLGLKDVEAKSCLTGMLTIDHQSWTAVLVPALRPTPGLWRPQALAAFAAGVVLSFLAAGFVLYAGRHRQRENLLASEARALADHLSTIFDSVNDAIFASDPETGKFIAVNQPGNDMFGYMSGELVDRDIAQLSSGVPPYTKSAALEWFTKARSSGPQHFEWQAKRKDGSLFWVEISLRVASFAAGPVGLAVLRDVTERKRTSEKIAQMTSYDPLTGLMNRRVFVEALDQAIARARQDAEGFAVLYLDLDHFKDVNDTLGHPAGDLLLQAVAKRLRASVRAVDTIARFGGDEFAVILTDIGESAGVVPVAERILRAVGKPITIQEVAVAASKAADRILSAVSEPFSIQGNEIHSGVSVGIAVYGSDAPDAEILLSHADVALYRAKSEGGGAYRFFTDAMDTEVRARVGLGNELREAIAADQFFLMYQPQVDIDTGRIVGLEALVRWNHPVLGSIGPGKFIPEAERSGLIVSLGRWVIREACRQAKIWLDAGIAPPQVAVNLSGVQFKSPLDLERNIAAQLAETGLPARLLELELTESVLMDVSREHNDVLLRLRGSGHRIAIDDFGSGYSSLDYLRRYPVDRIKIAQSFTADIGKVAGSDAIVRAALGLARELKIEVVVEGVETAAQLALLKAWGCQIVQGYYFAKPLPVGDVTPLLRAGTITPARDEPVEVTALT
jgi:diguanylate cyclase (GGDEF)-like protein/PAS domain S-box-containing protein